MNLRDTLAFWVRYAQTLGWHGQPRGQGLAEYALILALIAILAVVALIFLGGKISAILKTVGMSV